MNKFLILAFLVGCGGLAADGPNAEEKQPVDLHPDIFVPGQENRTDGSVWLDGFFNSPEAKAQFCSEYQGDDAWFCNESGAEQIGSAGQAWTVAEYMGKDSAGGPPCYGPGSKNRDCIVPFDKYFTYRWTNENCFSCNPASTPNCPNTVQEQAIHDGIVQGMVAWNGLGGAAMVPEGTPGTSGYVHITVNCIVTDPGDYADGISGPAVAQVRKADLPVGPHGKDEKRGLSLNVGSMTVNITAVWGRLKTICGSAVSASTIRTASSIIGAHESGHLYGYAHFSASPVTSNIMYPFWTTGCAAPWSIQKSYVDGLTVFSPGSTTDSVPDKNLGSLLPE